MKKIMVIHPEGNLNNNPNLAGIVEILCENGYVVDIYSLKSPSFSQISPCVGATFVLNNFSDKFDFSAVIPKSYFINVESLSRYVSEHVPKYDLIMGVDRGIIEAGIIAGLQQSPYGLISYEILFTEETGHDYKELDVRFARNVSFAVCQDKVRSHHLSREYEIPAERILNIPVAGRSIVQNKRTFLFHNALGLKPTTNIALYIGCVTSKWSGIYELLKTTDSWDDNWVLVLHHRYAEYDNSFIDMIINKSKRNVFISPFNELALNEIHEILNAADLGIGIYIPQLDCNNYTDRNNLEYIGMASGKIATYLQHGLPILINNIGEMSKHVNMYNLGVVADQISDVPHLLTNLTNNDLARSSTNCFKFFEDQLALDKTIPALLTAIKSAIHRKVSPHFRITTDSFADFSYATKHHFTDFRDNEQELLNNNTDHDPNQMYYSSNSKKHNKFTNTNKKMYPLISVVTPSYNQAEFLDECIDSVLSQNYPNLEYIIMDGGSTDCSVKIIKKYEKYLTYWQSQSDGGQYQSVNDGFRRSTGEIMAWLNSDDKYHPGAFWLVSDAFRAFPNVEWLMGSPTGWDEKGNALYFSSSPPLWAHEKYLRGEIGPPHIQQESTFWRRSVWQKAGGCLDTTLELAADMELWARFFRYCQLYTLHAPLGGFRSHPKQKTAHFIDRYNQEANKVVKREQTLYRTVSTSLLPPAPPPLYVNDIVSKAESTISIENFGFFTYSRTVHFSYFKDNYLEFNESPVNLECCDLKTYQDLLVFTFIKQNIPPGSRILEIGGGSSRVIKAIHTNFECWNLDKLEGVGNGPTDIHIIGFKLVQDYIGTFSHELPNEYFDFIFSISALEHVVETEDNYRNICNDISRVLKPDGLSLHCFDVVAKPGNTWSNGLLHYMFNNIATSNKFIPFEQMLKDPFTYTMTEKSYDEFWKPVTKTDYLDHGFPISYNILWQNNINKSNERASYINNTSLLDQKANLSTGTIELTHQVKDVASNRDDEEYLVTAIISSYNSEQFMRECLEDLENQTIADRLEIIVVDAASPQSEGAIVSDFQKKYSNIKYVRTRTRIGVYAAWNIAIKLARGKYITPFSTNDRLRKDAYEILVDSLEKNPEVMLVYGDTYHSRIPHETFDNHTRCSSWQWADYKFEDLMQNCMVGPHPMWHKVVHEHVGYFNEKYIAVGDQEFWLRIGERYQLLHISVFTGLYWVSEEALSTKGAIPLMEINEIHTCYQQRYIDRIAKVQTTNAAPRNNPMPTTDGREHKCSIIIPLYNKSDFTKLCMEALALNTDESLNYEVILVDNASTDGTADYLRTLSGDITTITNKKNLGFAKAINQAAKLATGRYLVLLNNDTIPHPEWLAALIRGVDRDNADIVGAKLVYPNGRIQHAGVAFDEESIGYHIYRKLPADLPAANKKRFMQCVTAACMLVKREVFSELKGFDEAYMNGFEDVDFCLRAGERGRKILYTPESVLIHFEETSEGRKQHDDQNMQRYLARWEGKVRCDDNDFYHIDGYRKEVIGNGRMRLHLQTPTPSPLQPTDTIVPTISRNAIAPSSENERARVLKGEGKYAEAFAIFSRLLDGGDYSVRVDMGDCLASLGRYDQALARYNMAQSDDPADSRVHVGIGVINLLNGKLAEAVESFAKALRYSPDNSRAQCGLGMAYFGIGKKNEAFDCFRKSLESDPENVTALHELIKASYELERYEAAAHHTKRYLMYHPLETDFLFSLAGLFYKQGSFREAMDTLERLLIVSPEYDGASELMAKAHVELSTPRPNLHPEPFMSRTRDHIAADTDFKNKGRLQKEQGRFEEALKSFTLSRESGDFSVIVDMGDCQANLGKHDDALSLYQDALERIPEDTRALVGLGVVNLLQEKSNKAVMYFNKALKIDPTNSRALSGLGMVRNLQAKPKEAFTFFSKALDSDPENLNVLNDLLKIAYESNLLTEAEPYLRNYLRYHPANNHILFSLTGLLYRVGKNSEALDTLDNLLVFEPSYEGGQELRTLLITALGSDDTAEMITTTI